MQSNNQRLTITDTLKIQALKLALKDFIETYGHKLDRLGDFTTGKTRYDNRGLLLYSPEVRISSSRLKGLHDSLTEDHLTSTRNALDVLTCVPSYCIKMVADADDYFNNELNDVEHNSLAEVIFEARENGYDAHTAFNLKVGPKLEACISSIGRPPSSGRSAY